MDTVTNNTATVSTAIGKLTAVPQALMAEIKATDQTTHRALRLSQILTYILTEDLPQTTEVNGRRMHVVSEDIGTMISFLAYEIETTLEKANEHAEEVETMVAPVEAA